MLGRYYVLIDGGEITAIAVLRWLQHRPRIGDRVSGTRERESISDAEWLGRR